MVPRNWRCPLSGGDFASEYALTFDKQRSRRLLIVPALFDEGNRMRRFTVEVMRRLDAAGIDSFLPDLPGCNESLQPLDQQLTLHWRDAMVAAAIHFDATHALGIRGGCLFTPSDLPRWHYAPVSAGSILRQMMRARVLASREAGREETREALANMARNGGIDLAGYRLSASFFRQFEAMSFNCEVPVIAQEDIGGPGLWTRAEPGEDSGQVDALAATLVRKMVR